MDDFAETPEKSGQRGGRKSSLTRWLNSTRTIDEVVRYRGESPEGDEYTWGSLHGAQPAAVRDVSSHFGECIRVYALTDNGTPVRVWIDPALRKEEEYETHDDDTGSDGDEHDDGEPSEITTANVGGFTPATLLEEDDDSPLPQIILPMPEIPENLPEAARTAIITAHAFSTMQSNAMVQSLSAMLPYFERTARTASQLHELVEIQRSLSEQVAANSKGGGDDDDDMGKAMLMQFLTQAQAGKASQLPPGAPAPNAAPAAPAPTVPPNLAIYFKMAMESPDILAAVKALVKKALEAEVTS